MLLKMGWPGQEAVKKDPHQCNKNCQLCRDFLKMFPHLYAVNNLDLCEGLITRRRQTVHKLEEFALDYTIKKPDRIETFNFRNKERQLSFSQRTDERRVLKNLPEGWKH